mmetsp:Transcript_2485/g.5720  ORF Transcript_2485/g.5720 Transcript_2485/m.5720 type:complete len:216 (+) Transcript_2485:198-845(+)
MPRHASRRARARNATTRPSTRAAPLASSVFCALSAASAPTGPVRSRCSTSSAPTHGAPAEPGSEAPQAALCSARARPATSSRTSRWTLLNALLARPASTSQTRAAPSRSARPVRPTPCARTATSLCSTRVRSRAHLRSMPVRFPTWLSSAQPLPPPSASAPPKSPSRSPRAAQKPCSSRCWRLVKTQKRCWLHWARPRLQTRSRHRCGNRASTLL